MFSEILLILSVAICIHVSLIPPTPPPPKERRRLNDFAIANVSLHIYKDSCWMHGAIEVLVLFLPTVALQFPQSTAAKWANNTFLNYFLPPSVGKDIPIIFSPPLRILAACLILFGSIIRYLCYRELGRYFTFHVALLDDHRLVTTGPYSIVRHPSYSGAVLVNVGIGLWHSTSGAWLRENRFYTKPVTWIGIIAALVSTSLLATMVVTRPKEEDKMLKKEFGKEWDEWATKVPYRLFPGIY